VGPGAPGVEQIGEYRILREVGRGGMGVVYEAEQVSLGRRVALKVLGRHAVGAGHHRERFEREARSAARLHHTNIVPVFGVGEEEGLHYYVMQFIQGLGLDEVIEELRRLRSASGTSTVADSHGELRVTSRPEAGSIARSLVSGAERPDAEGPTPGDGTGAEAFGRSGPTSNCLRRPVPPASSSGTGRLSDTYRLSEPLAWSVRAGRSGRSETLWHRLHGLACKRRTLQHATIRILHWDRRAICC
jgi:hypothetical protein